MPYIDDFFKKVAENVAEDEGSLWVREAEPGILEYAVPRLEKWDKDKNIEEIVVRIISGGGSSWEMFGLYSVLRQLQRPTKAIVYHAHSAGVIIALGCDKRVGYPTSTFLLHGPEWELKGRGDYLEDSIENLRQESALLSQILLDRTKITSKQIEANARREWWFTGEEALKLGVLTEIVK